jgi:hypothetical protein
MGRITWVCATCAQHFTRFYSANRHNENLHNGGGQVVRLLDYMIGATNGKFPPNGPIAEQRRKGARNNNSRIFGSNSKTLKDINKVTSEIKINTVVHDNIAPRLDSQGDKPENHFYDSNNNNVYGRPPHYYNRVSRSSQKPNNTSYKNSDLASWPSFPGPFDSLSETLKIEQLRMLLNTCHFPRHIANEYLKFVSWMAVVGNDTSYLDSMLAFLNANDTREPYYKNTHDEPVTTGSYNRGGSYSRIFDQTAVQKYQNEGDGHISIDVYSQGKAKIARIESLLLPYCPRDYVQFVIAGLSKVFEATGNLSDLDTALEYHSKNVEQLYARRGFMKR